MQQLPDEAKSCPIPPQHFYSIEYPGCVSPTSIPIAIHTLGGQTYVDHAFRRNKHNEGRDNLVDLNFRPKNPFSHPVPGDITTTNNLLLKVVKRKRRRLDTPTDTPGEVAHVGECTTEVIGHIPKTLRFRSEFNLFVFIHTFEHLSLRLGRFPIST